MIPTSHTPSNVVVVGGGLAGLACATHLHRHGTPVQVIEASDAVGGRMRTDSAAGFLLDRGFQALLTAYPEAKRVLDYNKLTLRMFYPGAVIAGAGHSYRVVDPIRKPLDALESLLAPVGTMADKWRLLRLRQMLRRKSLDAIFEQPEQTTIEALRAHGLSPSIISMFFRPFLGGIFLDKELKTSSSMFEFVFKMFTMGHAALPAEGMGAIPRSVAGTLPEGTIRLNTRAASVCRNVVTLESGERLEAGAVVIATDGCEATRLVTGLTPPLFCSSTCLYFVAEHDPVGGPILVLNGDGSGPINNLCVPSTVAPSYAPSGSSLISVTVLGNPEENDRKLETAVRSHLKSWFGPQVDTWHHLRTYRVRRAVPAVSKAAAQPSAAASRLGDALYICGDYRQASTLNGTLLSGRAAAEAILQDFTASPTKHFPDSDIHDSTRN